MSSARPQPKSTLQELLNRLQSERAERHTGSLKDVPNSLLHNHLSNIAALKGKSPPSSSASKGTGPATTLQELVDLLGRLSLKQE